MSGPTLPFRYPLDPTGVNPNNRVVGEIFELPNRSVRAIAPQYGAFFAESVVIRDKATNTQLQSTQYKITEMFEFPTGRYGKEICGIILITDTSVSPNVEIDYQALGGEYSTNSDAIIQMLNSAALDNRPVAWGDIISKPDAFTPAFHYHDIGDIYGFEYVVHAIERLRQAVMIGDSASHDEIYRYIDRSNAELQSNIDATNSALNAHINNTNNPHNTTKTQVGLGLVQNLPLSTTSDAQAGTRNDQYMTPALTSAAIASQVGNAFTAHVNNTSNPHSTTKAQVGLGNVDNFATANQTDAQAGTRNDLFMTPLRVAQAITTQAGALLQAHINDQNNPHNTTKAQVGLGLVDNYATAGQTDAQNGTRNDLFMTPLRTAQAITTQAGALLQAHINDKNNPHNTTAAQVGLGSVSNYATATDAESQAVTRADRFMTPRGVGLAIAAQVPAYVNAHANRTDNPHNTTAAQVGLGSVSNFPVATDGQAQDPNNTYTYMTPHATFVTLNTHAARTDNPHGTTKAQVGLSNVPNYGVADYNTAVNGAANDSFMTPYLTAQSIEARIGGIRNDLYNHINNGSNPHGTNKYQVGLGNVDNFPTASTAEAVAGARTDAFVTPYGLKQALNANQAASNIQTLNNAWGYYYDPATKYLRCWGISPTMYDGWAIFFWFRKPFTKLRSLTYSRYGSSESGTYNDASQYAMSEIAVTSIYRTVGLNGFGTITYRDVGGNYADWVIITYTAEGFADSLPADASTPWSNCTLSQFVAASGSDTSTNGGFEGPWTGTYPRNFSSGGGGGGGGGGSVLANAWVPDENGVAKRAGQVVPGDGLFLLAEDLESTRAGVTVSNRLSDQRLLRMTSESGITLTVSDNTPLTMRDGTCINSTDVLDRELPVQDENGFRWEKIVKLEEAGRGTVATIYCENQCYAAGDVVGRWIWTHNALDNSKV